MHPQPESAVAVVVDPLLDPSLAPPSCHFCQTFTVSRDFCDSFHWLAHWIEAFRQTSRAVSHGVALEIARRLESMVREASSGHPRCLGSSRVRWRFAQSYGVPVSGGVRIAIPDHTWVCVPVRPGEVSALALYSSEWLRSQCDAILSSRARGSDWPLRDWRSARMMLLSHGYSIRIEGNDGQVIHVPLNRPVVQGSGPAVKVMLHREDHLAEAIVKAMLSRAAANLEQDPLWNHALNHWSERCTQALSLERDCDDLESFDEALGRTVALVSVLLMAEE